MPVDLWIYSIRSRSMRISTTPGVIYSFPTVGSHERQRTHTSLGEGVPTKLLHHVPPFPLLPSPLLEAKEILLRPLVAVRYSVSFE